MADMINMYSKGVEPRKGDYSESSLKRKWGEDVISFPNEDFKESKLLMMMLLSFL